jgi:hypothetical protein
MKIVLLAAFVVGAAPAFACEFNQQTSSTPVVVAATDDTEAEKPEVAPRLPDQPVQPE